MKIDEEFAGIIPQLTEEEYKGLEASILSEGCRDALVVWGDVLVDGHNRYGICTKHNVKYKTLEKEFSDRDEVKVWIMRNQLSRRNLNDFQRIETVSKCADAVKVQAEKRRLATLVQNSTSPEVEKFPQREKARDELGKLAGVSGKTYEHAVEILDKAPKAVTDAVRKDALSINAGYEVTKLPPQEQEEISERIIKGEPAKAVVSEVRDRNRSSELGAIASVLGKTYEKAVKVIEEAPAPVIEALRRGDMTINQAYKELKNTERKAEIQRQVEELERKPLAEPDGLYDVIVMDPPWAYGTGYDADGRRCANLYPEMKQEDLKAIKVPAAENCVMFLWTTHKFIWDAKELLNTWSFEYRNMLVWDKQLLGMGNLIRMQCEFCLLATKGKPIFKDVHDVRDLISEPRREHSRKPEAFYELVNRLCAGRKLDYFSRTERDGWEVYGNDTGKFRVA